MSVALTEGSTTDLLEDLRLQKLDAVIGRCSTDPHCRRPYAGEAVSAGSLAWSRTRKIRSSARSAFACRISRSSVWLLPPQGTPSREAINEAFAAASLPIPVAAVEAGSTKIIHLTIRANPRMLGIVPSDVGHDIQRLGGVRRLPFPAPLGMPPVGLFWATRHRDTPIVRNVRSSLRELVRKRRD